MKGGIVKLELVTQTDPEYGKVRDLAHQIYEEVLEVSPTSFPSTFLALFDESDAPVGSVGLWRGEDTEEFLTEHYCSMQGIDLDRVFFSNNITLRQELGEACCLNMKREYRREFTTVLATQMYEYALATGIKGLFLIRAATLTRLFRSLGTELQFLCTPNLAYYEASQEERDRWNRVYFSSLRPECCLINIQQALGSYRERVERKKSLIPPFVLGERIAAAIG